MSLLFTLIFAALPSPDQAVRNAVDKGLRRLEMSATAYVKNRNCFSCHHQAVTVKALVAARERGFSIDKEVLEKQTKFTVDFLRPKIKDLLMAKGLGGASTTAAYSLFTLEAANHSRDELSNALVEFLLKKQDKDGAWTATTVRPPTEGSKFTIVALALQSFNTYALTDDDADERLAKARENALAFLRKVKPVTTEDYVFRLRGLVAGGVSESEIRSAREDLLKRQRSDGGWAQLDGTNADAVANASIIGSFFTSRTTRAKYSDAYATATSLVALRMAGLDPKDPAYQKGVQYLLRTQDASGGWIVTSRSNPIQAIFDNGDPGGPRSGFIGAQATGWAVLALLECCEKK